MKRGFGSDNHSGVHPRLLNAISAANVEHAPSYGTDDWSEHAINVFKSHFGSSADVYFVFNGTAANVLSLAAMTKSWNSVLCSDCAHVHHDECGAPEALARVKLIPTKTVNGKLQINELEKMMIRKGDQHFSQASVLTITQPTELGTTYSLQELRNLVAFARRHNLKIHMDGARIANAVHFLKSNFKEMVTDIGVDVLSFGGTKNGFLFGEAIVILNSELVTGFKFLRKQFCQLPSKSRFIAAQFSEYLGTSLWQETASLSHDRAKELLNAVQNLPGVQVTQPVESNAVFAKIPQSWVKQLRQEFFFYVWDETTFECRWMTSWDTQKDDILNFAKKIKSLS